MSTKWYRKKASTQAIKALELTKDNVNDVKALVNSSIEPHVGDKGVVFDLESRFVYIAFGEVVAMSATADWSVISASELNSRYEEVAPKSEVEDEKPYTRPDYGPSVFGPLARGVEAQVAPSSPSSGAGSPGSSGTGPSSGASEPGDGG